PDAALKVAEPGFNAWVDRLGAAANISIARLPHFLDALLARHHDFHVHGCRLSDHGLDHAYAETCADAHAARVFAAARSGSAVSPGDAARFAGYLMRFFGRVDAERGWTKQLHLGARRNVNTRMRAALGPDTGFDAIGDTPQVDALARYLDAL